MGQRIETSLLNGEAAFLMRQDVEAGAGADRQGLPETPRTLRRGIVMCFLTAECADGKCIQMCARQDHHFRNWMVTLGMEDIFDDPLYARRRSGSRRSRTSRRSSCGSARSMLTKTRPSGWTSSSRNDVGADPFLEPDEFLEIPEMVANDRVVELDDPTVGRDRQVGPLALFRDTPRGSAGPPRASASTPTRLRRPGGTDQRHVAQSSTAPRMRRSRRARGPPVVRVSRSLEVAYFLAGPFGATLLAELGARVIKVEPLEGDPYRRTGLGFVKMVHGKESIALDLKTEAGVKILHQLARRRRLPAAQLPAAASPSA